MWVVLALLASFFWGVSYFFAEHVYRHISVLTSLAISCVVGVFVFGLLAYFTGYLHRDVSVLLTSGRTSLMLIIGISAAITAEILIGFSIASKNATLSGLIEISYPLFIVLVGYILIRENNLNIPTAFGGLLIFLGVGTVYFFNR
jgi:uncharacterized membrane protein